MQKELYIKYDGDNSIDAIDLATSILNFAKLTQRIGKNYLPENSEVKVNIFTFEYWSVDTPILLEIVNKVQDWINIAGMISTAVIATPLDEIISIIADFLNVITFLKWKKPKSIKRDETDNKKVIVENYEWATQIVNYWTINYYGDNVCYKYAQKIIEPLTTGSSSITDVILSEKDQDWNKSIIAQVNKDEAKYFVENDESIFQDVTVVWIVYDMNVETFNWKIAIWAEKTSIWFKAVYNTPNFNDLVRSLKNKWVIKVTGKAEINTSWWSMYKYIELTEAILLQQPMFNDDE